MNNPELDNAIKVLSADEIHELNSINKIKEKEYRLQRLKSFFITENIFNKIKDIFDPVWVSYAVFLKGYDYEF